MGILRIPSNRLRLSRYRNPSESEFVPRQEGQIVQFLNELTWFHAEMLEMAF